MTPHETADWSPRQRALEAFGSSGEPLVTLYLPTPSQTATAEHRFDIRRRNAATRLDELDAPAGAAAAIDAVLAERTHDEGEALVVVASADEVIFQRDLIRPVDRTVVTVGPTPALLPLLAATQNDIVHVAVLLDRAGAEQWVRSGLGAAVEVASVDGDEEHIHRGHPGGWSQRRFQQRAENTWDSNAKEVAEELLATMPDEADVVVVGGDVRAVGFFRDHVPDHGLRFLEVEGSRSADHAAFLDRADVAVRTVAAERLTETLADVREGLAVGTAVAGDEALELLNQGRIDRLVVADDTFAVERTVDRFDFAVPMGGPTTPDGAGVMAPVTEGAVVLAVATGADVVVVSPGAALASGLDRGIAGFVRGER